MNSSRRQFLSRAAGGLAAAGASSLLVLDAAAEPTPASGTGDAYINFLKQTRQLPPAGSTLVAKPAGNGSITEDNILGPYYRPGAPFRAKVTPPLAEGKPLLVQGRVWSHATKRPLQAVTIDVWQANMHGRYDNDEKDNPPHKDVFLYRTRVLTDEAGYYEYETVHPGRYQIGPNAWRPSHIHYLVRHAGYRQLITQLYFEGDPHNKTDQFIKPSLICPVVPLAVGSQSIDTVTFDLVLAPAEASK